jgi:tetratricopeptide (TPR) repeat protein
VYRRGTQAFPKDKDFWNNLGYALTQQKRHDEAFDAYKKAVSIDAGFERGWANLAASARATGRKDPILQVPGLIAQMQKNLASKSFEPALANARQILEIMPDSADAHLSVGNLLFYLNRFDEAEKEIQRSIEIDPDFAPAHANLGRMYAIRQDNHRAREQLQRAIELDPTDADTRRALEQLK